MSVKYCTSESTPTVVDMAIVIWSLQASGAARSSNVIVSSNPNDLEYELRGKYFVGDREV